MLARTCRVGKFSSAAGSSSSSTTVASRTSYRDARAGCCSRSSSRTGCERSHATSSWRRSGRRARTSAWRRSCPSCVAWSHSTGCARRSASCGSTSKRRRPPSIEQRARSRSATHTRPGGLRRSRCSWRPDPSSPARRLRWIDEERLRLGELHVRALEAYAASTLGVGGTELSAAVRAGRKARGPGALSRVGAPHPDGGARPRGQPCRGAVRLRGVAGQAARRPRDQPVVPDARSFIAASG